MLIDEAIAWIESKGAKVRKSYDPTALIQRGEYVVQSIRIIGLRSIWPLPLDVDEAIGYISYLRKGNRRYEVYHL